MSWDIIILLTTIVIIIFVLYKNWVGASLAFFFANLVLGVTGILSPKEILSGFANEQVIIIIMLLLLGEVIRQTTVVEIVFSKIFQYAKNYKVFMVQLMIVVAVFSTFLNNTPIVAVMLPFVMAWGKKHKVSPSLLLIPLSYAAILGGTATLIGTSTNLIVNGMISDQSIFPGFHSLHLFDFFLVGGTMTVIGILYFVTIGHKLLIERGPKNEPMPSEDKTFYFEMEIREGTPLVDKRIVDTDIYDMKGLHLKQIIRQNKIIEKSDITDDFILKKGDLLLFTGERQEIAEKIDNLSGLTFSEVGMMHRRKHIQVSEIVVSHNSSMINKQIKDIKFRSRFDSVPIAVHRNGEYFSGRINEIQLKAGDLLLFLSGEAFPKLAMETTDFYLVSKLKEVNKVPGYKIAILFGGLLSAIALSAFGIISLFIGLATLFGVLVAIGLVSPKDIKNRIDYDLYAVIALSLSFGVAMMKTGTAEYLAHFINTTLIPFGPFWTLLGLYFITTILAAYITNKAAVALVFPIALSLALSNHFNPIPFVLVVAFASAANFMTPIGYQTNIMVYGPGNYSFKDYFRVGTPLTIIYMLVAVTILYYQYF